MYQGKRTLLCTNLGLGSSDKMGANSLLLIEWVGDLDSGSDYSISFLWLAEGLINGLLSDSITQNLQEESVIQTKDD